MIKKSFRFISYSGEIKRKEATYKVNAKKYSGIDNKMLHKALDQLDICLTKYKRVLVVRFDLHQPNYTGDNKIISGYFRNLQKQLKAKYEFKDIGYWWAREVEKSKNQHYHCVLFLNGNIVRHSNNINKILKNVYTKRNKGIHIPVITKPYYFIDNQEIKEETIYRISYLAKGRCKGYKDTQAKNYSTSRITL
jgi:DNA replicative helicase MCM subunit Mcm2 (Cdc46/Mcm family)